MSHLPVLYMPHQKFNGCEKMNKNYLLTAVTTKI